MGTFFAELKRRHIYRVAAAYAVVAWVLIQLVNNIAPGLRLPEWAPTLVIVLLLVGFPITLLIAWIHQLAPSDGAATSAKTSKLDWTLIGALVVVIALVSYQQISPPRGAPAQQQVNVLSDAISIAVLPFANVSGDVSQEFFSDGMTDEIIAALAKVPSLQVVARTSAFQFKGDKKDMRAIGQALGARYLIDGSVRKEGNRVRISAQLVQADNGVGVWTESYDRELTSIFTTQEDIAQAIAGALRVPLGLKQGDVLVRNRTSSEASYEDYLRAKALVRARGGTDAGFASLTESVPLLEQVVARDPDYAPAWALLGQAYASMPLYDGTSRRGPIEEARRIVDASLVKGEAAARRAIQLDANLADGYVSLGLVERNRGKSALAEDQFKQALALDPNNPDALHWYADMLGALGRLKDGLVLRQRLRVLEPFVPVFNNITATHLWLNGENDAAIALLKAFPNGPRLAEIYASMGRYSEAADAMLSTPPGDAASETVSAAARLLRTAPAVAASPQSLPRLEAMGFVYLYIGAPDRVLDRMERGAEIGYTPGNFVIWHPTYAPVRKTERFRAYIRNAGLVDYWRARGWPNLCRPVGADDFVCD